MAGNHGTAAGTAHDHQGVGHVVPMRILLSVWGVLVVLTWATVAATYFDFGSMNIYIALGIAVVKSSLVVLYFMHLRYDNPFNSIIFCGTILFVMLFISFLLIDTKEYHDDQIPGYAPRMEEAAKAAEAAKHEAAPPASEAVPPAPGTLPAAAPTHPTGS